MELLDAVTSFFDRMGTEFPSVGGTLSMHTQGKKS